MDWMKLNETENERMILLRNWICYAKMV